MSDSIQPDPLQPRDQLDDRLPVTSVRPVMGRNQAYFVTPSPLDEMLNFVSSPFSWLLTFF